jgi:hypothetical protein
VSHNEIFPPAGRQMQSAARVAIPSAAP